jgi:formate hydrogenlyase subunit 3/multisubunit Na+/H+ antiporter MnhD subunit
VIFLLGGIAVLVLAGAASIGLRSRPVGEFLFQSGVLLATVLLGFPALRVLLGAAPPALCWEAGVPGGPWCIGLDRLSAAFLLTIMIPGSLAALFGVAYLAPERSHRAVWLSHADFAFVLAALSLVALARSTLVFLAAWEAMALGAYALIVTEHEQQTVRRAGLIYLVATHAGTLALAAMFALWGQGRADWTFTGLQMAIRANPDLATAVFALALIGFGIKAGLVPFHFWLPPAHAAAPSHVSALLSGVVIKSGIYGFLRVIELAGSPPSWWSWLVLTLGVASAVLGVLWALVQHDIKRLLAYHSVENIGIILIGIGVGGLGLRAGHPAIAVLGFGAAVLHTLNHALFKSALFLAAGSVYRATGTRSLDRLGGLGRRMPKTWIGFLIGAAAIVGLPPLNGFVSEWLAFLGLLRAGQTTGTLRLAVFAIPALALVGGLALACFAKVAGIVFLGRPRSPAAAEAREVPSALTVPVLVLAALCLLIGVAPVLVMQPVLMTGASLAGIGTSAAIPALEPGASDVARLSLLALGLVVGCGLIALLRRLSGPRYESRAGETWGCGYPAPTSRMQYTASSFAAPLAALFGPLAGLRFQRGATVFHSHPIDLALDGVVYPAWRLVQRLALRLRPIQQGRIHLYLLYVVMTLVALLVYFVLFSRGGT